MTQTASSSAQQVSSAPAGTVYISNGRYPDYILGAKPDDTSLWLFIKAESLNNPYCHWLQFGDEGHFILYNLGKAMVMAYEGGNGGPLVMEDLAFPAPNAQAFSWGGGESWGARALQAFIDSGQNVDARGDKGPQTGALHTRGWRDGDQMELTWNANPLAPKP
ncbi:MAG: hypothetical protein ACXVF0_14430 [Blastococcus sp.]